MAERWAALIDAHARVLCHVHVQSLVLGGRAGKGVGRDRSAVHHRGRRSRTSERSIAPMETSLAGGCGQRSLQVESNEFHSSSMAASSSCRTIVARESPWPRRRARSGKAGRREGGRDAPRKHARMADDGGWYGKAEPERRLDGAWREETRGRRGGGVQTVLCRRTCWVGRGSSGVVWGGTNGGECVCVGGCMCAMAQQLSTTLTCMTGWPLA